MVDRCLCHDVTFAELLALHRQGLTFRQLSQRTGCCTGCGLCEPYVHVVLRTGRVVLPVLDGRESTTIVREARARGEQPYTPGEARSSGPPPLP